MGGDWGRCPDAQRRRAALATRKTSSREGRVVTIEVISHDRYIILTIYTQVTLKDYTQCHLLSTIYSEFAVGAPTRTYSCFAVSPVLRAT